MKFIMFLFLMSCGTAPSDETDGGGDIPSVPNPDGGDLTFAGDIQPLLKSYCAECHSQETFIKNEVDFRKSKAPTRIGNKSMPPSYAKNYAKWGDKQRTVIKEFLAQ